MQLLTIHGSSRRDGNTEALAKIALDQLDKACYKEIFLLDHLIKPIIDERHSDEGFTQVDDDYESLIEQAMLYDALLFATEITSAVDISIIFLVILSSNLIVL